MVPRSQLPSVGVIGLGVGFVAFATYGLLGLFVLALWPGGRSAPTETDEGGDIGDLNRGE